MSVIRNLQFIKEKINWKPFDGYSAITVAADEMGLTKKERRELAKEVVCALIDQYDGYDNNTIETLEHLIDMVLINLIYEHGIGKDDIFEILARGGVWVNLYTNLPVEKALKRMNIEDPIDSTGRDNKWQLSSGEYLKDSNFMNGRNHPNKLGCQCYLFVLTSKPE